MSINHIERDYLTYRPVYGYTPIYMAKPYKGASNQPVYTPSKCIESLANILPSSILSEIDSLLDNITVMQKRLEQCLQGEKCDGVSFSQYKQELNSDTPNYSLIKTYEDTQRTSLTGSIQAEVYKYVIDLETEFRDYKEVFAKQTYEANSSLSANKKVDEDRLLVDNMVKKDINGELTPQDINNISIKTQINHYALDRVLTAQNYVKGLNAVCCRTLNDRFDGNVVPVFQELANTDIDNVKHFNDINKVLFKKKASAAEHDRRHGERLNSPLIKSGMNETMTNISTAKANSREPLIEWISSLDSDDDNSPITYLIEEVINRLEFLDNEYSSMIQSMYALNKLDAMQKNDLLSTLQDKKSIRQLVNTVDALIEEREKNTFDINKFIQKHKLQEPGTMCTK